MTVVILLQKNADNKIFCACSNVHRPGASLPREMMTLISIIFCQKKQNFDCLQTQRWRPFFCAAQKGPKKESRGKCRCVSVNAVEKKEKRKKKLKKMQYKIVTGEVFNFHAFEVRKDKKANRNTEKRKRASENRCLFL